MPDKDLLAKAEEELKGEAPALIKTFDSKGFKILMKWLEAMEYAYEKAVIRADTPEEWREAKSDYQAVQKLRLLPQALLAKVKSLDAEGKPQE